MRTLWAVLTRELAERRQIVWLGLFLGVLCPVVADLPLGFSSPSSEVRDPVMLVVSATFSGLMLLFLGLGLFASDQATGRAGFYLSRPIRPWQLLVGRVVAAVVVVLVGTSFVALPTLFLQGDLPDSVEISPFGLAAALVVLALAVGHVAAVALRLRGRWTLFDVAALGAAALFAGSTFQNADLHDVHRVTSDLPGILAFLLTAAAMLGIWVQLRYGGTQRGRLHAVFSLTFWILFLSATAFSDARLRVALNGGWDAVESFVRVEAASDGSVAWLTAERGLPRPLAFVVDSQRDAVLEVGPIGRLRREPLLEGRTVVWLECDVSKPPRNDSCDYRLLDLDSENPQPRVLGIPRAPWDQVRPILLSPDGRRLANVVRGRLTVYSLPGGRPEYEVELGDVDDLVRFYPDGSLVAYVNGDHVLVSPDGSTLTLTIDTWPDRLGEVGVLEHTRSFRLVVDPWAQLPKQFLERHRRRPIRAVGDWIIWTPYRSLEIHRMRRDGTRQDSIQIPGADAGTPQEGAGGETEAETEAETEGQTIFYPYLGPELEFGRVLTVVGAVDGRKQVESPFWTCLTTVCRGLSMDFSSTARNWGNTRWTTHYVDLDAGRIVASFEGFRAHHRRFETPSGPEAWLQDEHGMPYRFDPDRLDPRNPVAGLEPVFRPPWDDR